MGRAPGQEFIDPLDPVDQSFHWRLVRIQKNMVLEPAEAELKGVLFARVQAKPSFGCRFKRGKDATTGCAGDALAVKVNVVSAVALLLDNLPERRLERRRQRLSEDIEHALVKSG